MPIGKHIDEGFEYLSNESNVLVINARALTGSFEHPCSLVMSILEQAMMTLGRATLCSMLFLPQRIEIFNEEHYL